MSNNLAETQRHETYLRLPDLAIQNIENPVKFEYQINTECIFDPNRSYVF